ncbi:MAG: hypothetical protein HUJ91_01915 [Bacteroidales bacterium]|nr:hypothetical protein [Bacteroidales bacterium]UMW87594.1 beta-galactosidase [uncultured Bacteroidales bacterium]
MKCNKLFVGAAALLLTLGSCSHSNGEWLTLIPGEPNPHAIECIGAEFDPHFYSQNVVGRKDNGVEAEDFEIIRDRVTRMGLHKFRIMIQPHWFEPYNDNDDPNETDMSAFRWNTVEMQSLYQILDLAQELSMKVNLTVWGCVRHPSLIEEEYSDVTSCFMTDYDANRNWVCPPNDVEEFGENFAALVKYLIEDKGYTCVSEITPFNEPGGDIIAPDGYMKVCRALDRQFRRLGVRDKVRFNLSDNIDTHQYYLEACAAELVDIADIFNSHTYIFGYETPNDTILAWERNNVNISLRAGLKHIVGEFGSNQCVGASRQRDINTYLRGVLITREVLNFFNAGAVGVSYWGLIDQYYGWDAPYEAMQQLGLWRSAKCEYATDTTYSRIACDFECRPQFYAYSLLSANVRPGAKVCPIDLNRQFAAATAFVNPDGGKVFVVANQSSEEMQLAFACEGGKFDIIRYEEGSLPSDGSLVTPSATLSAKKGALKVRVAPCSVVVCAQKQ